MRSIRPPLIALVAWVAVAGSAAPLAAQDTAPAPAPDPPATFERRVSLPLSREVSGFLDVVDAFDREDDFDVDVRIEFERTLARGAVQREDGQPGRFRAVAGRRARTSTLRFGVDVGLFRDLALRLRVPVILSDVRELDAPAGVDPDELRRRLAAPVPGSGEAAPLFDVPFRSTERSGLPHLEVGLAWGPLNQTRAADLPTLVFLLTGRFAVSEPMGACREVETLDPKSGGAVVETQCRAGRQAGIGDGTHGLRAEVRTGWQTRYAEPYAGVAFDARWPTRSRRRFLPAGDIPGYAQVRPPWEVGVTAGTAFIPWQDAERFQRIELDLRGTASYLTAGRDYTPLFDALGTSSHPGLTTPRPACVSCGDPETAFEGLTDRGARGLLGGGVHLRLQAARYVRFAVGVDATWATPHLLTGTAPCGGQARGADDPRGAGCPAGEIGDPHHRSVIDLPGQRFRLVDDLVFQLYARATARF